MSEMELIKKLELKEAQQRDLPLFYNFISYNLFFGKSVARYHYNDQHQYFVNYYAPEKPISKILKHEHE